MNFYLFTPLIMCTKVNLPHDIVIFLGYTLKSFIRLKLGSLLVWLNFNLHYGTELGATPIQASMKMFNYLNSVIQFILIARFPAPDLESLLAVISFWNAPHRRFRHELKNHLVSEEEANEFPSCWSSVVNKHLLPWR